MANTFGRPFRLALVAVSMMSMSTVTNAEAVTETVLPLLSRLPVTLLANDLIVAGDSKTYELVVFNQAVNGGSWQTVSGAIFPAKLVSRISDDAYPNMSAFEMNIIDWERSPTTKLHIVLEATSKPCLVSGIDSRLFHNFTSGREINVSNVYFKDSTRLVRAGNVATICTALNGQLAILFGAPVSDMLPILIVTYDNTGSKAAVSQLNLDFPTYDW